jgi:hypothetical protein
MQFYQAPDQTLHQIDPGFASMLPTGCVPISEEEATAILNPKKAIEEVRIACWEAIKVARDVRTTGGGYKVGEHWFHSDTFSRTQQMGLVMLGASLPAGVEWKTMNGTKVVMTPALAQQIFAAAAASDIAIFAAAESHRAAMLASADPATYDYSGGWPPVFGE